MSKRKFLNDKELEELLNQDDDDNEDINYEFDSESDSDGEDFLENDISIAENVDSEHSSDSDDNDIPRVADALNVHISTVNKISSMTKQGIIPSSPKKMREKKKPVVNVDDFSQCTIRNTIYNVYRDIERLVSLILLFIMTDNYYLQF
ncbi:hypothetical protein MML48_9g00004755 [Holotrichia oblita]|uniref:Uncharacterized protein n=1 Tax=Holotrichia oblita TaxID=644536 RepID=A0ACB9SPN6_HOLOL|nr:hypothetical protein MML48_9g00004755 [Holotrichia oblita]